MSRETFAYLIFLQATREQVWSGLTEAEYTRVYWMHDNVSDWKPGSRFEHVRSDGSGTVDIVGEVLEADPPHLLSITWAQPADVGDDAKTSRVSFTLEPQEGWPGGPWTQVQLEHTDLEPDSEMLHSISWGWPAVLSGLKTLLERGDLGTGS